MADTYTTNLNLTKPEPGAAEDTWGISLNSDLDTLDAIFSSSGTQINLNPNQVNFADNKKAIFGTGSDLEIYHDGSHSYIQDSGSGNLRILVGDMQIRNYGTNENIITSTANAEVSLYYNASEKLATTSTGIDVTGTVVSDALTVQTAQGDISIDNSSSTLNFARAGASYIRATNSLGHFNFITGANNFTNKRLQIASNGDISFYDDTGTTQGLFWDASTERLGLGTTSPTAPLSIGSTGSVGAISNNYQIATSIDGGFSTTNARQHKVIGFIGTTAGGVDIYDSSYASGEISKNFYSGIFTDNSYFNSSSYRIVQGGKSRLTIKQDGEFVINDDSLDRDFRVESDNNTHALFVQGSDGNVGIGTSSPTSLLSIGTTSSQTISPLDVRKNGANIEFGHTNTGAGYYGTIGAFGSLGYPYIGFSTDCENNANTFSTRGHKGNIIYGDLSGNLIFAQATQSSATGQTPTERARIDSSGRLLIGQTSSNGDKLEIQGDANVYAARLNGSTTGGQSYGLRVRAGSNSSDAGLLVENTSGTDLFIVRGDGNVGIGTSSPSEKLDIVSASSVNMRLNNTGNNVSLSIGAQSSAARITAGSGDRLGLGAGNTQDILTIASGGNVGIGTSSPDATLKVVSSSATTLGSWVRADNYGLRVSAGSTSSHYALRIANSSDATLATFNGDGKVGIGTSTPDAPLTIHNSSDPEIRFGYSSTFNHKIAWDSSKVFIEADPENAAGNSAIGFRVDGSEKARIDSSGLFLVGKTTGDFGTQGSNLVGGGHFVKDGNTALYLNRLSSDGSILALYKDSSLVGSIGTLSNRLCIGTDDVGLFFDSSASNAVEPFNISTNSSSNGLIDLGSSSTKFKDLHLSGTANVGGLEVSGANARVVRTDSQDATLKLRSGGNFDFNIAARTDTLKFLSGSSERARIDSSGNLLVGKTAADSGASNGVELIPAGNSYFTNTSGNVLRLNRKTSDGDIARFDKDGTTVGSIGVDNSDNLVIEGNSTHSGFQFGTDTILPHKNGALISSTINLGNNAYKFDDLHLSGTAYAGGLNLGTGVATLRHVLSASNTDSVVISGGNTTSVGANYTAFGGNHATLANIHRWRTGGSEVARIDASGNLLIGQTAGNVYNQSSESGFKLDGASGNLQVARSGGTTAFFNRMTSDGTIVEFRKDGTLHGNIGIPDSSTGSQLVIAAGISGTNTGVGLRFISFTNPVMLPCRDDGSNYDNAVDLGSSTARFDDIYATNSTIQTSDRNEKQDIQELSDAEQRVAVACKGLIRRYKFNSAVTEKGDDARYHFGIIAQDLQDAFTAEGLDAGDYGMFISSTYTDDNGIEQTRLGVRYNELLAFIIATL